MKKTLKEQTTTALIWSFIDKFGQQIIYTATGIVLARILSTKDIGLVGALTFFTAISTTIIGSGFGRALMNKPEINHKELNSVFFYFIGSAVILYGILFLTAPLISLYYKEPSLVLLSRVLFISIIFSSFGIIQNLVLTKSLSLHKLARANIYALLPASICAMVAAYYGFGVWALVIQSVLMEFFKMITFWHYGRWRPTRHFDMTVLKELYPFSSKVLWTNLINTIFGNLYSIIIGRIFSISQLGIYSQASKWKDIPTGIISSTFRSVSQPLLSGVNDNDERLKRILSKLVKTIALISFPVLFGMILIAKPMFIVLITEKWLQSVPIFQILCFSGTAFILNYVLEESILAKGRSDGLLVIEIIKKVLFVLLIIITIKYGLIGLATGWAISSFLTLFLSLYLSKRIIGYSVLDLIKDCFPYFAISSVLCVTAYFISLPIVNNYLFLGFCISFVALLYIFACRIFKLEASEEMFSWMEKKRSGKKSA